MLPPRLRWKLRIVAQQLEKQLDYWKNLWRGTQVTTRMCPSCRALVGVQESVCSLCGARLRRRPSGLGKLLANILPQYTPVSYGLLTANFLVFLAMFATEQQGTVTDFGRLLTGGNQQALVAWGADVAGLVAQGRTVAETLEIARDVARKLLEARAERDDSARLESIGDTFDYPLIVGS